LLIPPFPASFQKQCDIPAYLIGKLLSFSNSLANILAIGASDVPIKHKSSSARL